MKKSVVAAVLLFCGVGAFAQQSPEKEKSKFKPFIAYDFGQAMVNSFRSASGEVGVRFPNRRLLRLVHMNVQMTEQHLSSDFAAVVKGDKVAGSMFGFEAFYSLPVLKWNEDDEIIYLSPSLGYYNNKYWHTELDERFEKSSPTVGLEVSYRETNIFGVKGLYYAVTLPVRVHFNPHEKRQLGETTILGNRLDSNIWFFVGFEF